MLPPFEPLKVLSLKEACARRLEELILSGELKIGQRLPSERDLAARLQVSRPVLHQALVDLDAKGLVTILPRRGVLVNDFRRNGSLALLSSLLAYHNGELDPAFAQSLFDLRLVVETETARQAALNRTAEQLREIQAIVQTESQVEAPTPATLTELDFQLHLVVAIASGNLLYPLLLNSFKSIYTSLTGRFFQKVIHSPILAEVWEFHQRLLQAIADRQAVQAARIMEEMLRHGEAHLKGEF